MLCLASDLSPDSHTGAKRSPCQNLRIVSPTHCIFSFHSPFSPFFMVTPHGNNQKILSKHKGCEWHKAPCIIISTCMCLVFTFVGPDTYTEPVCHVASRSPSGSMISEQLSAKKKSIMEMRWGDYTYPTDYRAHKQWGHETLWTILNVLHLSGWALSPWRLFGSERK